MKNRIIQLLGGVPRAALHEKSRGIDSMVREHSRQIAGWTRRFNEVDGQMRSAVARETLLENALATIAACETANSNGTVRKMAKIAREALNT